MPISRREFLAATAATVASPFLSKIAGAASAADDPKSLAKIFEGIELTDQHGLTLKPAELFKDKPCIVLFGYNGCPRCKEISKSVAAVQKKLLDEKQDIPIIVVSAQPEIDRKPGTPRNYVAGYYEKGVRQFKEEPLPEKPEDREKLGYDAFDKSAEKSDAEKIDEQKTRLLHVVCPKTTDDTKTIQTRISEGLETAGSTKKLITAPDPKMHTSFITLFDKGQIVEAYRALDENQKAPPVYTSVVATDISRKVADLAKSR